MRSATEIARALAAGETSAAALVEAALARIAERDGAVRAFVTVNAEGARIAAAESDARRAAGAARGPLDGVPVAIKDNIAVRGLPRTAGTRAFPDPSPGDASVTARLRAAGAVILGTLNMHEGALGATTDNPFWGRCDNPAVPGHTPGGSSGGSAAAIAAGFVPLTLGTDTMGSVRIPAAYCGLWGLKPSRGLIPVTGLLHLSWTLDTIGPLASAPEDIALALAALVGPDPQDASSLPVPAAPPDPESLTGVTLALPEDRLLAACEPAIRAAQEALVAAARTAGARLVPFDLPQWDPGALRRAGLLVAEAEAAHLLGPVLADRPEGFSDGFRAAIDYGARAPAPRVMAALRLLTETGARAARALDGVDALLLPTAPQRAFAHGAPVPATQADLTALANAAGLPALAFPLPAPDGGAPCSAQLVGPFGHDRRLVALASLLLTEIRT